MKFPPCGVSKPLVKAVLVRLHLTPVYNKKTVIPSLTS